MRGDMEAVHDDVRVRLGFEQFAPLQDALGADVLGPESGQALKR
jgi:hypothetical protein